MASRSQDTRPSALLNYTEAAERLGIKLSTLYALVSQRRIPHVRIGPRFVMFDPDEIERWIKARRVQAS